MPKMRLSPISRRAFFKDMGSKVLATGALGIAAAGAMGQNPSDCQNPVYSDGGYSNGGYSDGSCGYCNGLGRDYYHCDGDYCDYLNYSDTPTT